MNDEQFEFDIQEFAINWVLVVGAVSAAAGLFNAVDEAIANRNMRSSLQKIKDHLLQIDNRLRQVEKNTEQILSNLNKLPSQIRHIVTEIVETALLEERYSSINSIRLNVANLNNWRHFRINKPGWLILSEKVTYLVEHEDRLSHMIKLIEICELALAVTRGRAKKIVLEWLKMKYRLIYELFSDLHKVIIHDLATLKELLDDQNYIKSHNLSQSLPDFHKLSFTPQATRTKQESYTVRVRDRRHCTRHFLPPGEPHEPMSCYWVYRNETRTRTVADSSYNHSRNNHINKIQKLHPKIGSDLVQLGNLAALLEEFAKYARKIQNQRLQPSEDLIFFAEDEFEAEWLSNTDVALEGEEDHSFNDYYSDDGINVSGYTHEDQIDKSQLVYFEDVTDLVVALAENSKTKS